MNENKIDRTEKAARTLPKDRSYTEFSIPSYQRIADDLRKKVASGSIAHGVMLPGRKTLAVEYGVSLPTIERAVADLLADGTLRADRRRGTFAGTVPPGAIVPESETPEIAASLPQEIAPSVSVPFHTNVRSTKQMVSNISVGIAAYLPHPVPGIDPSHDESRIMAGALERGVTMVGALERAITQIGGSSHFHNLWPPTDNVRSSVGGYKALVDYRVDVVVIVDPPSDFPALFRESQASGVPLVIVNRERISPPMLCVCYDHMDASYQAAKHLIDEGCTNLLFFSPHAAAWVDQRKEGVLKALEDAQLPEESFLEQIDRSIVETEKFEFDQLQGGYVYAKQVLSQNGKALLTGRRGIVAANDDMAMGFIKAATELGFVIRRDYLIIGFDDRPASREYGLSTMRPPLEELGREAARLAVQAVTEFPTGRQVCLHSQLIARSSSRFDSR